MKKLLIITFSLVGVFLTGCLKDTPNVDFSNLPTIAELEYPGGAGGNGLGSGLEFFSGGAMLYPPTDETDTITFMANIASPSTLGKAVNITVGVDANALNEYNNNPNNPVKYLPMPDSCYSLLTTSQSIPAGSRLATFQFVFYPSKFANLDQTLSYMVPLSITAADGITISSNFSTIYLHTIGNPIAGTYNQEWIRYNNSAGTPPPAYDLQLGPTTFSPVDPTTIEVQSGTGVNYLLSFTNNGGTLSNFSVSLDPTSVTNAGITITSGPFIITADPVAGKYQFNFTYNNSAGAGRNITDIFTK